jgi:hypothetical protein
MKTLHEAPFYATGLMLNSVMSGKSAQADKILRSLSQPRSTLDKLAENDGNQLLCSQKYMSLAQGCLRWLTGHQSNLPGDGNGCSAGSRVGIVYDKRPVLLLSKLTARDDLRPHAVVSVIC